MIILSGFLFALIRFIILYLYVDTSFLLRGLNEDRHFRTGKRVSSCFPVLFVHRLFFLFGYYYFVSTLPIAKADYIS